MSLLVRPATLADAEVIVAFNRLMAQETENKDLDLPTLAAGVGKMLIDPERGRYFVAESEGRVVGQLGITLEWSDWRDGYFWWVQSVYVAKDARRLGVFTALYEHVSTEAGKRPDVVGLRLYVEHDNVAAQATYRKLRMEMTAYRLMERGFIRLPPKK